MNDIHETKLPGVGVRHDFETSQGRRIGVIAHHAGHRELLVYDRRDPDTCEEVVRLDEHDAHMLAEMLGAAQVRDSVESLRQSIEGMVIDWLPIAARAAAAGRSLGELHLRAETGVTVIAVLGEGRAVASPGADHVLAPGETVVVVGQADEIARAAALLQRP